MLSREVAFPRWARRSDLLPGKSFLSLKYLFPVVNMKIYKYCRCENLSWIETILSKGLFYFCNWKNLNDPMEGYFKYHQSDHAESELEKIVNGKDSLGVCCFSLVGDDMLMWTHYASNHKGVCVEVDTDLGCSPQVSFEVIRYCSHIPLLRKRDGSNRSAKELLSTKISLWQYEHEIRAFCSGAGQQWKVGALTRIILGLQIEDQARTQLSLAFGSVPVTSASLDYSENRVII